MDLPAAVSLHDLIADGAKAIGMHRQTGSEFDEWAGNIH